MMASRRSEAGVSRPKQKPSKRGGMFQFVIVAVVVVVVIVALFLLAGGGKKRPAPRTRVASGEEESVARTPRKPASRPARTARSSRTDDREKRREERLQRREESRISGGRTSRTASGGYSRGGSSRSSVVPTQLRAILTDGTGSRFALVGERRLKAGDDVDGRRIIEVSGDAVKVEYRQNTYTVRVGEKLY